MEVNKIKKVDMGGLSKKEQSTMKKHAEHHSLAHLKYMIGVMRNGKSFKEAHMLAQKKVGK
tara:strand:+ start:3320 stop:3502 length:183 start_codon:yes stop_codon:yes gene_type:complete